MQLNNKEEEHLLKAKQNVRQLKLFYIHLAGYIIVVALLFYNLYIVEGEYKGEIISLNLSVLVTWTAFILIHAWRVFKEKKTFKNWEDQKLEQFLKEEDKAEATFWE